MTSSTTRAFMAKKPFATASAFMAKTNQLLSTMARLRLLLVMFVALTVSAEAWGATSTITITQSNLGLTGSYTTNTEKTIDGVTFVYSNLMKNKENIQAQASGGEIYNSTAIPGNIVSVAVTHSGTERSSTIYFGTSAKATTESSPFSGTETIEPTSDYQYFYIKRGSSNAAYWTQIVITYETSDSGIDNPSDETVTGTINFNSNAVEINAASVIGDDDLGNSWTITTVGTTSFTQQPTYSQVGSSTKPATSITFTTTLPEEVTITNFSVKFGGFSGTTGTITLKVDDTPVGTGSLNADSDVTVETAPEAIGTVLTVTVTGISKGVRAYYISYTYEASSGNSSACGWVETDINDIKSGEMVVITMTNSDGTYAMSNNNGTSNPPSAVKVTVSGKTLLETDDDKIADNIKWNVSNNDGTLTIYPNGKNDTWLYCTNTNNGVRVGTDASKTFKIDATSGYLFHNGTSRYIGVYNSQDWRCYAPMHSNISNQTLKFYKYVECGSTQPSVTLNLNGGTFASTPNGWTPDGNNYKQENVTGSIDLPTPTRIGYNFDGWYDGETKVNSPYTPSKTVTLTAEWIAKTTSITLDANTSNNGSGANSSVTATYDQTLPEFTACTPATGYTLDGYYTEAIGGTKIIDKDGKFVSDVAGYTSNEGKWKNESATLTLYAQYTINSYTVTFDDQGHGIKPDNQIINHGEKVNNPGNLTEDGFIFGGWYKESGCANAWDFENDVVTSSITLYAKWTAKTATSLTWSADTYTATIDADNTFPTLTIDPEAIKESVQYTSSDETIATIDANGNITLLKKGETTITATFTETATHTGATDSYTLTVNPSNCRWVEVTDNTTLEDGDEVVITMVNGGSTYALPNNPETSTPDGVPADGVINGSEMTSVANTLKWTVEKSEDNYIFHPNGDNSNWLYCTDINDGVCVGTNSNKTFTIDQITGYLKNIATSRYLRIGFKNYTEPVWRCYTTTTAGQTLKFYKRECLDASKVWVEGNLTNVTCDTQLPQQLAKDGSITLTFTAADGYVLPNTVTVTNATKTWNKEDGTLTISNPTNNVTVTVEADKQHTITWNIAGDETLKTYVVEGSQVELPDLDNDPTSCSDIYTTFVGWYTEPSSMETNPSVEPQGEQVTTSTVPTGNATYYAVWADGSGAGGEQISATLDFSTNKWNIPTEYTTTEQTYTDGNYSIKLAGTSDGYKYFSTSNQILLGKSGAYMELPAFPFKVSKIVASKPDGTVSGNVTWNVYSRDNEVSTAVTGCKNGGTFEIADNNQTAGTVYTIKVTNANNLQIKSLDIYSLVSAATGYISSCCQSPAVVTVTPADASLELNIDGTASTTVNISQTGGGNGKYYEPTVSPADGASLDWAALGVTFKQTAYDIYFTATKAGTYTITGNFTETIYDCQKTGSATINVVANPILQVSEPTITSECGTEGTPVAVTIDSRYLTGSSLTAQIATTTDTEHGVFKICTTEDGDFATTDLTGLSAGKDDKATVTIYVRYDAALDNIDAATGTLTITDGTTSQTITLTTTPICGTSIRMTPTDANSVRVTTANGQWTRTKTPIHLSGSYLLQNLTGDQGAKVELTSSNSNFKFVKPDVGSPGTAKYESEKITNNTWGADVYLVYTPTTYNANETTTITAKVITFGGTTEHATATIIAYGRSFPETFVLALNTGSEWVALPADMIAPYGTGCATGVGNHDPYPITVDNDANPATATLVPARAVYKGAARNTPMTNPWTIQFESNTQAGYYLFGSVDNDGANTSIANLAQATGEGLKWELKTEDNITYRLSQMSASAFQLGYNATTNYMGQYQSTATNFKYDFRILPVTNTCTYYIEPVMTLVDYTDDEAKIRIQYDGTNLYQISMDNKANWTNITGEIDCKDLTFTLPNAIYRGQNVWLKPQGDLCEEVVSSVACHIPAPVINHPGNKNFIGTANQLFNGTFTITGNDLYEDVTAINITTNSNPAISATITNGTITVTMAASPVGTYTTNITFDAVGAEEVTVKVTIEITSGRVITWMANGIEYEKTEVGEGASPVLPTEPSPDDYACGTKEFVGWTTIAEITNGLEPDPLITDASQITNDMDTLYAVFADCITNHKPKDEYVLVTDINKLKAGDKIIFAYTPSEYVAGDFLYDSSNDLSVDGTATFSKTQPLVIPSTETLIFTLGGSAGAWTFTTLDGRKLGAEDEKELSLTTEGSGITTWNIHSIGTTNGDADIEPSTTADYGKLTYISVFSLYKENSGPKKPQIYKRVVGEEDIDDVTKHRIQLSVLDEITYDEEVREDISFVLPASVGSVGCDGKVFVGWTTTADLTSTSEPIDFYDKGVSVLVTEPKTYYAVFATESKNASTSNITLNYNNLGITDSYTQKEPTVSGYTFVVTGYYRNSNNYFQMKRSEGDGILYNKTPIPNMKSITVTISESTKEYAIYENDVFNDYEDYGNPITPEGTTSTATANVNAGNEYFTLKVEEDGTVNISSVVIEYYPTTYSDYTTNCTSASPLPARKSNVSAHASNAASKAYISPAAKLSNAECIGYQNFITQCSNVYVEEWDVDKIYIEAVEGMSSVELHSKENSTYTHIATTTASRNADGTYTITATNGTTDLSDIACEKMRISIKDASNNVIAAQLYKVPIIVENAIKTNDNWFVTTLGASTCANCDVIIRDNAVLEHVAGGVNDFRNLTIYETAALRNEQTILSVEDLLIRSKRDDVGYAIIEKDNGFISANTVAHTKRIDAAYWYTFALPYDCKIADITQANGKSMGEYGKHWGIKYYDGQARQESGTTAGQGNSSQFWEPMPVNGVLEANHGYIIALFDASVQDDNEMRTIYFPPAENKEYTESGTGSKATTIVNWTDNLECDQQHHGWNFTSTPYISIFNPSGMADNEDGAGMNASNVLMTGKINLVDGSYYEETLEDVYVSIPSTQGAKYYDQQLASSTSLMPFSAYFVQAVDPETGSSETKTLTYAKGARTLPTSAPARAAATKQRVLVELKTTAPDGQTDNTGVWVDERYTTNYEIAADLTKMYATGTKPQLYTWANNQRMAYNALPDNAATYVPLGLYAPVAGNYMIAINQRVSRLQGAESVELLYNNAVVANLLVQDYILTANQGENSGYALRVHRKAQVSTATDNISGSTITLIANDGYISLTGVPTDAKVNIYDMLGRLIATQNADGQTVINMPMIPQGVYNIVINSTNGHQTMKTIIR